MSLESPHSVTVHEDGDGLHQQQDVHAESKPAADVVEGQSKNDGEVEHSSPEDDAHVHLSTDLKEVQPEKQVERSGESAISDIDEARDLSEQEPKSGKEEPIESVTGAELEKNVPTEVAVEENQSSGEMLVEEQTVEDNIKPSSPDAQDKAADELQSASAAATDRSSTAKSDLRLVIEGDLAQRVGALDGIDEFASPRPLDEEQPFVSEQFEDETQTIVGEGSVMGDQDFSDEGSPLCSPRSVLDEDIIVNTELEIVACAAVDDGGAVVDVVVPDLAQNDCGDLVTVDRLADFNAEAIDELVNNLKIDSAEVVITENVVAMESEMAAEGAASVVIESELSVRGEIVVASPEQELAVAASDSPPTIAVDSEQDGSGSQPETADKLPVNAPVLVFESSTMEAVSSDNATVIHSTEVAACVIQEAEGHSDNQSQPDAQEVVVQECSLVVKKKSSWFPKRLFNSCTLI